MVRIKHRERKMGKNEKAVATASAVALQQGSVETLQRGTAETTRRKRPAASVEIALRLVWCGRSEPRFPSRAPRQAVASTIAKPCPRDLRARENRNGDPDKEAESAEPRDARKRHRNQQHGQLPSLAS